MVCFGSGDFPREITISGEEKFIEMEPQGFLESDMVCVDHDEESDVEIDLLKIHKVSQSPLIMLQDAVFAINKKMKLNVLRFPTGFLYDENAMACFLFDIVNFPKEMVLKRIALQGGVVDMDMDLPLRMSKATTRDRDIGLESKEPPKYELFNSVIVPK